MGRTPRLEPDRLGLKAERRKSCDQARSRSRPIQPFRRAVQPMAIARYAATPSTGSSAARPRIMSDAFSAIIIVEL